MADPLHGPNEPKAPSSPWPPLRPTHTRRRAVARLLLLTGAVALVCGLVYITHRRHPGDITSNAVPQLRALRQLLGQDHHSSSPSRRHLPATPDPAPSAANASHATHTAHLHALRAAHRRQLASARPLVFAITVPTLLDGVTNGNYCSVPAQVETSRTHLSRTNHSPCRSRDGAAHLLKYI